MSGKPLAIDLFCGLVEPKFGLSADAAIEELVACRAENPDHVWLHVRDRTPRPISLVLRLMGEFHNAVFPTRFARLRDFWEPSSHTIDQRIWASLSLPFGFVCWPSLFVFPPRPLPPQFSRRRCGTLNRAIALIGVRRLYRKVRSTAAAIRSILRRAFMLLASDAARPLRAIITAPLPVRPRGSKGLFAQMASQLVHRNIMP